jgi:hypothetical protein
LSSYIELVGSAVDNILKAVDDSTDRSCVTQKQRRELDSKITRS